MGYSEQAKGTVEVESTFLFLSSQQDNSLASL